MATFKVGDKVRIKAGKEDSDYWCREAYKYIGLSYPHGIVTVSYVGEHTIKIIGSEYYLKADCFTLAEYDTAHEIKQPVTMKIMTSLTKAYRALTRTEPEKTFFKAGVTNEDGSFTPEGSDLFMQYMLKQNGDAFKTEVVDAIIEARKEDK